MSVVHLLFREKASQEVKDQLPKAKAVFVNTVFQFLSCTKVISYA